MRDISEKISEKNNGKNHVPEGKSEVGKERRRVGWNASGAKSAGAFSRRGKPPPRPLCYQAEKDSINGGGENGRTESRRTPPNAPKAAPAFSVFLALSDPLAPPILSPSLFSPSLKKSKKGLDKLNKWVYNRAVPPKTPNGEKIKTGDRNGDKKK